MPVKPVIRLLGVARNRANGFPARLLGTVNRVKDRFTEEGLAAVLKDRPQANRRWQGMATGPCPCWDA